MTRGHLKVLMPHVEAPAPRVRKVCRCAPCVRDRKADDLRALIAIYEDRLTTMRHELARLAR